MLHEPAPFSLAPLSFRFRALSALAGRARAGGERETVLACFVAARLAAAVLPDTSGTTAPIDPAALGARATAARRWYAAIAVPAAVRVTCARLVDATAGRSLLAVAEALLAVAAAAAVALDEPARDELRQLAEALRAGS